MELGSMVIEQMGMVKMEKEQMWIAMVMQMMKNHQQ